MIPHDKVFGPLTCTNSKTTGYTLGTLRRGTIEKLRVIQLSGSFDGFSYVLYNTVAACQSDGTVLPACIDPRLYQITPVMVVDPGRDTFGPPEASSNGEPEGFPEDGVSNLHMPFEVQDDNDGNPLAGGPTNTGEKIVIKIVPNGSATKTFGVSLTVMDPMII